VTFPYFASSLTVNDPNTQIQSRCKNCWLVGFLADLWWRISIPPSDVWDTSLAFVISAGATESCTSGRPPSTCLAERAIPYQNNRNLDSVRHQQHHQSSTTFAGPGISPARASRRYRRRPVFVFCLCSDTLACPPSRGNCQFLFFAKRVRDRLSGPRSPITNFPRRTCIPSGLPQYWLASPISILLRVR